MTDFEQLKQIKAQCLHDLKTHLPDYVDLLNSFDTRLLAYIEDAISNNASHANLFELLGIRKELRDVYREAVIKDPVITEVGSMGNIITKQNPLCNLLYQQEGICQQYAKMLGLTAAKAAAKPEDKGSQEATSSLDEFIDGIKG